MRTITARAGVTARMVNRYFGSKEGLFGEVVADTMRDPVILSAENLAAADVARRLTATPENPLDGFLILFRSASSETAARIARERIAAAHHTTAAQAVRADHGPERAAIFLAFVAGFQLMRQMIRLEPLAAADSKALIELLTPAFQTILG